MIKKQLLFALRRLIRHKLTTTINILGLTLGVLSCLVIYLYVSFEFSYDTFHADRNRIYRVVISSTAPNGTQSDGAGMPYSLAADLRHEATGFSAVTGIYTQDSKVIVPETGRSNRVFTGIQDDEPEHIVFAEPQYLDFFKYQWLAGNPATALKAPFSVVLTETEARRYFDHGNPADWMGRTLVYFDSLTVTVSGIVKDWQQNSDFGFTDLISYNTIAHSFLQQGFDDFTGFDTDANAFVKISPGTTVAQVEKQFPAFVKRHKLTDETRRSLGLQPLEDIHFDATYADGYGRRAHKPTLYALAGIALFILVIAAINFINLSTAQAVLRAREVGVRKVLGSSRGGLVWQFLSETGVVVLASMTLALLLANPVIAALHGFIPQGVRLRIDDPDTWLFIASTIIATCLLAGWYPARALSSILPAISLRGQGTRQLNSKSYLRKGLIVFQFTVSLVFIIGTIMVGRQIHYMINTDLGFKKDAIVTIDLPGGKPQTRKDVLAAEIGRIPSVQQVCLSTHSPEGEAGHMGTHLEYKGTTDVKIDAGCDQIDTNYISLYGLTLVAGRNFQKSDTARRGSDPASAGAAPAAPPFRAFILNETAAKALGFRRPADAVGHHVSSGFSEVLGPVVGIVKDFHSEDLHEKIQPFFFTTQSHAGILFSVRLASADLSGGIVKELLRKMQEVFTQIYPGEQFQYSFFDESIAKLYRREQKTAQIINLAMGIAIFISCMGLFGLAAFTANQRTREIGIRKVLGAGVPDLVSLLSRDFIVLVLLSILIAAPLAGWGIQQWLQDFAYQTTMPLWIYILAGFAAVIIALLTVSFQAIRAATANPVDSLKAE